MNIIKEDFRDILSYKEALAIICISINYAYHQAIIDIERMAKFIGLSTDDLKKMGRVFEILKLGKIQLKDGREILEVYDVKDEEVKNTMYEAIWNKKDDYAAICQKLIADGIEGVYEINAN